MFHLLLALLFSAAISLFLKIFSREDGNRYGIIIGNYLTCSVVAFLMLPDKGLLFHAEGTTYLVGIATGLIFIFGMVVTQTSILRNGATLTSAFSKLGLLISLALAILAFGERPRPLQIPGVILVLAAIFLINSKEEGTASEQSGQSRFRSGGLALLLLCFLCSGTGEAMSKVFERVGSRSEDGIFLFLIFFTALVISLFLAEGERRRTGKRLTFKKMASGITVGLPNYFSSFMLLRSLVTLPALLVYPVFSTGSIVVVMLVSTLFLKERITRRQLLGIGLILAALVLLNL